MKNCYDKIECALKSMDYNNLSFVEIGEIIGVNEKTVRLGFKHLSITKKRCKTIARKKKEAVKLAISKGKTTVEIANEMNYSRKSLTSFMVSQKIKNNNKSKNVTISEAQYQVIIGSLMGDGCMEKISSQGARLRLKHSEKQYLYVLYKKNLLSNLCNDIKFYKKYDKRFSIQNYTAITLDTKSYRTLNNIREEWYKPYKILGKDFFKIGPLGLAIWFMDDGYKSGNSVMIAAQSFNSTELNRIKIHLQTKFNIETTVRKNNTLYIKTKSYKIFYNTIKNYLIESMLYKLPII